MSEVVRSIEYDGEDPVLVIRRKIDPMGCTPFAVRMNELWQFSSDHNEDFDKFMWLYCSLLVESFGLGIITTQKMAAIATVIEDGIEELLKTPPRSEQVDMRLKEALEEAIDGADFDGSTYKMNIVVH